eukprot:GHVO01024209.1.p1 GENE.GHVO01024209.1~~GHVO01024209.1.p1  ORF type:complete len:132 (+),score=12.92 GHVO01024209.1:78-473(+)
MAFHVINGIYIFLQNIVQNLKDRFPDLPLLENFSVFSIPVELDSTHGRDEITELAIHFHHDPDRALLEWQQICASVETKKGQEVMEWITRSLQESHPILFSIAAVGLLLPTSTADCERGFSLLKRVKTTHR